jgi:hypothetical protein
VSRFRDDLRSSIFLLSTDYACGHSGARLIRRGCHRRCAGLAGFGSIETLGFGAGRPFQGGSTMTRHLVFAITLIGAGLLLNSPGEAQQWRCEDQAANCLGRCADRAGGSRRLGRPPEQMSALRLAPLQMRAQRDHPPVAILSRHRCQTDDIGSCCSLRDFSGREFMAAEVETSRRADFRTFLTAALYVRSNRGSLPRPAGFE